ncbi:FlgO family outer membrane protein [Psychrosphaera sp. 1_MG-2023]|uniref:FlgO family outer membrane protein n=1 Tax=Psychrosphaera algicola TaxID=3023714 RepID=A0ABT5FIW2_9GAMM|nr:MULTISPECIES: FlgO family outer membrane protein [unclassified Psychrosphaera]MDC2891150.1 FlgO family outer membrane protein [Psychrosphaera sp. G1-22]MDO6718629.1 FlgO family outer membrane protein [Psychrosphaera sp. 1_MG-2023]
MKLRLLLISSILGLAGCAAPNYHAEHYANRFKQYGYGFTPDVSMEMGTDNKNLNAKILKKYADRIAFELSQQVDINKLSSVSVASFVDLDDNLTNTHPLGNKIAEDLLVSLQETGYRVVDFNVSEQLALSPQGSFIFNRNNNLITTQYVISGIINYSPNGANINARLVSTKSGAILAAYTLSMPAFVLENAFPTVEGQDIVIRGR